MRTRNHDMFLVCDLRLEGPDANLTILSNKDHPTLFGRTIYYLCKYTHNQFTCVLLFPIIQRIGHSQQIIRDRDNTTISAFKHWIITSNHSLENNMFSESNKNIGSSDAPTTSPCVNGQHLRKQFL